MRMVKLTASNRADSDAKRTSLTLHIRVPLERMRRTVRYWWIGLVLLLGMAACTSSETANPATGGTQLSSPPGSVSIPGPNATTESAPATGTSDGMSLESSGAVPAIDLPDDPTELMRATIDGDMDAIVRKMVNSGNQSYIPVLLEFMRIEWYPDARIAMAASINVLAEGPEKVEFPPERTNWGWWIEWLGQNPQVKAPKGYDGWKGELFSTLDAGLGSFLYEGVKTDIRIEEIVWGGVAKDGIPDLRNPPVVPANEAWYMEAADRVFGVSINGEARAYPLRILNAHEMANDVVGGVPFALAY